MSTIRFSNNRPLNRGKWTAQEDKKLVEYIELHGHQNWRALPEHAGLMRCGKSCRLRWLNYLRPGLNKDEFSPKEEHLIRELHASLGNRWSIIAQHLDGRTDNDAKNYWKSCIRKKLAPRTHKSLQFLGQQCYNLSHPSQPDWTPSKREVQVVLQAPPATVFNSYEAQVRTNLSDGVPSYQSQPFLQTWGKSDTAPPYLPSFKQNEEQGDVPPLFLLSDSNQGHGPMHFPQNSETPEQKNNRSSESPPARKNPHPVTPRGLVLQQTANHPDSAIPPVPLWKQSIKLSSSIKVLKGRYSSSSLIEDAVTTTYWPTLEPLKTSARFPDFKPMEHDIPIGSEHREPGTALNFVDPNIPPIGQKQSCHSLPLEARRSSMDGLFEQLMSSASDSFTEFELMESHLRLDFEPTQPGNGLDEAGGSSYGSNSEQLLISESLLDFGIKEPDLQLDFEPMQTGRLQ